MGKEIKILHLEDNDLDAEIINNQLQKEGFSFQIYRASNKKEFLTGIQGHKLDIIISDFSLPDYDGISALQLVKQSLPGTPFLFISSTLSEDKAIQALRYGATDYVPKNKIEKLGPVIKRIIHEQDLKMEKRRAEKAFHESMQLYSTLVETQPAGVSLTDLNGRVLYVSKRLALMLGYNSPEEMIGLNSFDLICEEDRARAEEDNKRTPQTGGESGLIYQVKRKDGSTFKCSVSVSLLKDEEGNNKAIIAASTDISDLIKAKEEAEEMNRLKSYFLANMSHELRTPLISIIGFAELLQDEIKDADQKELLQHIYDGGQRLNNTLNSILEISKLEAISSSINLTRQNLAAEINKRVQSLKPMAQRKNLFMRTELKDTYLEADIDSELFSKAFFHLVSNAVKYTKSGGIIINLNHYQIQEKHWAVIKIIDTGVGIPKENLEKIFIGFRQVSEGYCRSYEGVGLGLTISQKIIEFMNGKIEVKSEVGNIHAGKAGGSEFSIWLPASLSEEQISRVIQEDSKSRTIATMTKKELGMPQILLVEDNPSNRNLMKRMLGENFMTTEAENGLIGLSYAVKRIFDVVLMDINLGAGIDGVETMNKLRKIPGYIRVPIIAVTAYVMPGDRERFLNIGFDGYLPKPFSSGYLISMVNEFLQKAGGR